MTPGDLTKSAWFWKISGTDGAGNAFPNDCGVQMPEGYTWYYWSVTDQDAWNDCSPLASGNDSPHDAGLRQHRHSLQARRSIGS